VNRLVNIELRPGDVFLCDGRGWLDGVIEWFQTLRGRSGKWARWSHAGIILDADGLMLETTNWRTSDIRRLPDHYAGSRLRILRWPGMQPGNAAYARAALRGQVGRVYPYWRLLAHALGAERWLHGRTMECSVLAASFLSLAGFPLLDSPWAYGPDNLEGELAAMGCEIVFNGSLRAAGHIEEV
jgi:hypothetical protein